MILVTTILRTTTDPLTGSEIIYIQLMNQGTTFSDQSQSAGLVGATFSSVWRRRPLLVIFTACVSVELSLVLLDLTVNWLKWSDTGAIRRLFNITREDGLASFFAIMQTVAVSFILWLTWFLAKANKNSLSQQSGGGWLLMAIFLTYIAIDDGAMVHERIGTLFSQANENMELPSYGWQFIMGPVFAVMGITMIGFLWQQGKHAIRRDWLIASISCLAAAVALDYVEGMENGYRLLVDQTGWSAKTIRHFSKSFEEFLEMLGMSILLVLFLRHLSILLKQLDIRIKRGKLKISQ